MRIIDFEGNKKLFSVAGTLCCPPKDLRSWHRRGKASASSDVVTLWVQGRGLEVVETFACDHSLRHRGELIERHEA